MELEVEVDMTVKVNVEVDVEVDVVPFEFHVLLLRAWHEHTRQCWLSQLFRRSLNQLSATIVLVSADPSCGGLTTCMFLTLRSRAPALRCR